MKSNFYKWMIAMVIASSIGLVSGSASAYSCRTVGGHWNHGVWVGAHRVCGGDSYRQVHCRTQGGYWRHGYWHPARRVCW